MMKTEIKHQNGIRRQTTDDSSTNTYGLRGGGVGTWQAKFGMALTEDDLLFAAKREPIVKRTVIDVANDIFAKGFILEEVAEKPNPNWSRQVSRVLDGLDATAQLTKLIVYERLFGWAILALTYMDYGKGANSLLQNPREILQLYAYSSLNCNVNGSDEDRDAKSARFGLPILYSARKSDASLSEDKIHYSRVIHCATRLLDHPWKGQSIVEVLYDDQTILRNARWSLGETLNRTASGIIDFTLKVGKKADVDKYENDEKLQQLNQRSYFVHDGNTSVNWVGPAGRALNPEPYVDPIMESVSCGSRIPLSHLRGANAGTLAGSEVNDREYWGSISSLQKLIEPTIWQLIDRLMETGQISKVTDYRIVWPAGFELTETAKADLDLKKAQALNLKSNWSTIDELRLEEGKDPLPNGEGNIILGLQKQQQSREPTQEQNQNKQESSASTSESEAEADSGNLGAFNRLTKWIRHQVNRNDMISEIVASYLKEQLPKEHVYKIGEYYPADLPLCLRMQYFKYTQPKELATDQESIFGLGYLWQACIAEALDESNIKVLAYGKIHRLKVPHSDLSLVCEPDFELDVNGKRVVLEVKSVNALSKFSQPTREHLLQATPYIKVCRADSAIILYLNKQTGETKEFPVPFEEENLTLVFERAKRLDQALQSQKLPAKCGPGQTWQCSTCAYQTECETFQ